MTTVDVAFIGGQLATQVHVTRVTGFVPDATPRRVQIARVEGFATGGPSPDPARVQIMGLHGFARDPAPVAGQSLTHLWDGSRFVQVTPMVWNGSSLEAT